MRFHLALPSPSFHLRAYPYALAGTRHWESAHLCKLGHSEWLSEQRKKKNFHDVALVVEEHTCSATARLRPWQTAIQAIEALLQVSGVSSVSQRR